MLFWAMAAQIGRWGSVPVGPAAHASEPEIGLWRQGRDRPARGALRG